MARTQKSKENSVVVYNREQKTATIDQQFYFSSRKAFENFMLDIDANFDVNVPYFLVETPELLIYFSADLNINQLVNIAQSNSKPSFAPISTRKKNLLIAQQIKAEKLEKKTKYLSGGFANHGMQLVTVACGGYETSWKLGSKGYLDHLDKIKSEGWVFDKEDLTTQYFKKTTLGSRREGTKQGFVSDVC